MKKNNKEMKENNNVLVYTKAILAFNATVREQVKGIITSNDNSQECIYPPILDVIVSLCHAKESNIKAFAEQLQIEAGELKQYCQNTAPDLFPEAYIEAVASYFEYPEKYYMEISKIHQKTPSKIEVTRNDQPAKETTVTLSRKNKALAMTISLYNQTDYADNLTEFDLIVENAIGCLYEVGNENGILDITPQIIARFLKGLPKNASVSDNEVKAIDKSLHKLFSTFCKLRYTGEAMRKWGIQQINTEETIIKAKHVEVKRRNGSIVSAWRVCAPPAFYEHSKQIRQIISIPCSLLNTKGIFDRESRQITLLKFNLITQVLRIKSARQKGDKQSSINFAKLCEKCYPTASKSKKMQDDVLGTIDKLLQFFKRENFIQGYRAITNQKGRCTNIEITPQK